MINRFLLISILSIITSSPAWPQETAAETEKLEKIVQVFQAFTKRYANATKEEDWTRVKSQLETLRSSTRFVSGCATFTSTLGHLHDTIQPSPRSDMTPYWNVIEKRSRSIEPWHYRRPRFISEEDWNAFKETAAVLNIKSREAMLDALLEAGWFTREDWTKSKTYVNPDLSENYILSPLYKEMAVWLEGIEDRSEQENIDLFPDIGRGIPKPLEEMVKKELSKLSLKFPGGLAPAKIRVHLTHSARDKAVRARMNVTNYAAGFDRGNAEQRGFVLDKAGFRVRFDKEWDVQKFIGKMDNRTWEIEKYRRASDAIRLQKGEAPKYKFTAEEREHRDVQKLIRSAH